MPFGFYIIMAAQFFSALADNALLIVAIAVLREMQAPPAYEPLLKTFFTVSYVVLAAFVGAFADSMPKWRVMFISNAIKIVGCIMMFFHVHPLFAYAIVGLGAAAYSPAKYGILTEYLPHRLLVVANGWIEGLTVGAIILGVVIGGTLIQPGLAARLLSPDLPFIKLGIDSISEIAIAITCFFYLLATLFNLYIPDTGVEHKKLHKNPLYLFQEFNRCMILLWRDRLGQVSLAVTTLFWGASATLQFIVIKWAEAALHLNLSKSSMLQGVVAIGVALIVVDVLLRKGSGGRKALPVLAVGMGIYLPPSINMPIIIGAFLAAFLRGHIRSRYGADSEKRVAAADRIGTLFAAGLIVGESLIGVILAFVIVISVTNGGSDAPLALNLTNWGTTAAWLGLAAFIGGMSVFAHRTLTAARR